MAQAGLTNLLNGLEAGTFDCIPNVDYVRNNLAVTSEFEEEMRICEKVACF